MKQLFITALLGLAAALAHAQASGPIRIVGSMDLSGAAADVGKDALVGTQYAIEQLNRSGGVLGRQLVFEYQDNGSTPQRAISQAGALLQDGAAMLMGPMSSAGSLAVTKAVSAKMKVPMCISTSGSDDLTMKEFQPYIYSITANNWMETRAVAAYLAKQPYKRYAIMSADYAGGRNSVDRFKEFLKEYNPQAEIVVEEYPKFGAIDYTASINKIIAAKPDYVYSILFASDLVTFTRQANGLGFFKQINNHFSALYDENTLKALGDAAAIGTDGAQRAPASFLLNGSPQAKAYATQFKAKHGFYPSDWSTLGYDCVMTWAAAATAAKTIEADAVMKAIREGTFNSPRGSFTFGKLDHQANVPIFYGKLERSKELNQAVVVITAPIPGASVRPT